jgi:hypothetical protein
MEWKVLSIEKTQINLVICSLIRTFAADYEKSRNENNRNRRTRGQVPVSRGQVPVSLGELAEHLMQNILQIGNLVCSKSSYTVF